MDINKELASFKKQLDRELTIFLDQVISEASKKDILIAGALRHVKKMILAGGKRLRPAMMYFGYIGAGGKEKEKMLKTSMAIELIHTFLLIHDDIMDRDDVRHGQETIHAIYKKIGKKYFPQKDEEHFGNSMGLLIGDMVAALGSQVIFESKFPPALVVRALSKLQSIVSLTVIGQAKDMYMGYKGKASEKEILRMYEYKTARYTLEGPFQLGAILGGASDETIRDFEKFSVPLGIAFQIQDDILGIFGSEKKLGKPIGSDIEEGKQTLLLAKALKNGNSEEKKIIKKLVGKGNLSQREVEKFRTAIVSSGALKTCQELARKMILEGKAAINEASIGKEAREFLLSAADYMMSREM